jgi:TonB family protein
MRTQKHAPSVATMMRTRFLAIPVLFFVCLVAVSACAQDSPTQSGRKVVRQTMPRYPEIARRLNLEGTVKVMAIVSPDGKVKRVDPVGGSPLLVQAAEEAVSQWKFAAATAESREVIELHFSPKESQ